MYKRTLCADETHAHNTTPHTLSVAISALPCKHSPFSK